MATTTAKTTTRAKPLGDDHLGPGDQGGLPPPAANGHDSELLGQVVQSAHDGIDRLADSAAPHLQRLQDGMSTAGDSLREAAGQLRHAGEEWTESLRCTVRERPLTAIVAAAALGLLIARLTR